MTCKICVVLWISGIRTKKMIPFSLREKARMRGINQGADCCVDHLSATLGFGFLRRFY